MDPVYYLLWMMNAVITIILVVAVVVLIDTGIKSLRKGRDD